MKIKEIVESLRVLIDDLIQIVESENSNIIELGDIVIYPDAYPTEEFEVVGIRKTQVELEGDWSGGTHHVKSKCWIDINSVKLVKKKSNPSDDTVYDGNDYLGF